MHNLFYLHDFSVNKAPATGAYGEILRSEYDGLVTPARLQAFRLLVKAVPDGMAAGDNGDCGNRQSGCS